MLVAAFAPPARDVAALANGRVHPAKLGAAASTTRGRLHHADVVRAGRDTFAAGPVVYALLTPAHAGGRHERRRPQGARPRRGGKTDHAVAPWMVDVLDDPGRGLRGRGRPGVAAGRFARAASPTKPWLDGAQTARAVGKLEDPGLRVTATVVYADAARAAAVAEAAHSGLRWVHLLGPLLGGVSIDDVHVVADAAEVRAGVRRSTTARS